MKIRTDFVTNSSSSSFVLVIRIGLKNGKVLKFIGDGGIGEGGEKYYQLMMSKSPRDLAENPDIDALIQMLKESVYEERDDETQKPVFTDESELIRKLRNLDSMDDIEKISVNGDLFGFSGERKYSHTTYYLSEKIAVVDEGGAPRIVSEGTGGDLAFAASGFPGINYGKAIDLEDGYKYYRGLIAFDSDIVRDEEAYRKVVDDCAALLKKYQDLADETKTGKKPPFRVWGKSFKYVGIPGKAMPGIDEPVYPEEMNLYYLGGRVIGNAVSVCDYVIIPDRLEASEEEIKEKPYSVRRQLTAVVSSVESLKMKSAAGGNYTFYTVSEFSKLINDLLPGAEAYISKSFNEWKKGLQLDPVTNIFTDGTSFCLCGHSSRWIVDYVKGELKPFAGQQAHKTKSLILDHGGILEDKPLKCDFLVIGPFGAKNKNYLTMLEKKAAGKAQCRIIAEDDLVRMLLNS